VAFFAVMYYSALRPEEAISLVRSNATLPDLIWNQEKQAWEEPADAWGELHFRGSTPDAGREWTDDLLRIYASCLEGQDEIAKRRITEALRSH
jgi:hypothetical protein